MRALRQPFLSCLQAEKPANPELAPARPGTGGGYTARQSSGYDAMNGMGGMSMGMGGMGPMPGLPAFSHTLKIADN